MLSDKSRNASGTQQVSAVTILKYYRPRVERIVTIRMRCMREGDEDSMTKFIRGQTKYSSPKELMDYTCIANIVHCLNR